MKDIEANDTNTRISQGLQNILDELKTDIRQLLNLIDKSTISQNNTSNTTYSEKNDKPT